MLLHMKSRFISHFVSIFGNRTKKNFKDVLDGKILCTPCEWDPYCRIRLIALADIRVFSYNDFIRVSRKAIYLKNGTVVAVASGIVYDLFVRKILPNIKNHIILIVLDYPYVGTDSSVSNNMRVLDDYRVEHMLAENWIGENHPKLTILPIGVESPFADGSLYGKTTEAKFLEIADKSKLPSQKPLKVLVNAHLNKAQNPNSGSYNQRQEMENILRDNPLCDFWSQRESRENTWELHRKYAFELCPEGNGLDTHRFYEALWLNTIPIVKRNSLAPMYKNFSCVIVNQWQDINEGLLKKGINDFYFNKRILQIGQYIKLLESLKKNISQ